MRTGYQHQPVRIHALSQFPDQVSILEVPMAKTRAARGLLSWTPVGRNQYSNQSLKGDVMRDMRAVNLFVNVVLICMICLNVVVGSH
jgi:hypothetical protein